MALSGKFRFRKATLGALILQVEDVRKSWWSSRERPTWRDARAIDLAATEFRLLLDLRVRFDNHGWVVRRSRLPPIATRIMA
jgi:hypothetical protein